MKESERASVTPQADGRLSGPGPGGKAHKELILPNRDASPLFVLFSASARALVRCSFLIIDK